MRIAAALERLALEGVGPSGDAGRVNLGWGFTLGGSPSTPLLPPRGFGWDGGTGTTWRSNPSRGVTGILFTQRAAASPAAPPVVDDFWAAVNAAAIG